MLVRERSSLIDRYPSVGSLTITQWLIRRRDSEVLQVPYRMNTALPDAMLFDDHARRTANQDIDECIKKFSDGRTNFPRAEVLAFACDVLLAMGGCQNDPEGRQLVEMLSSPRGVSYASAMPLLKALRERTNIAIDKARAKRAAELQRIQNDESGSPF